jgi:hypothetical protein
MTRSRSRISQQPSHCACGRYIEGPNIVTNDLYRLLARGASPETLVDLDTAMCWMHDHYGLPAGPILSSEQSSHPPAAPYQAPTDRAQA